MDNKRKQIKAIILNVIPDERLGGPQQRVLQVAKRLKEHGFSSIVAMPKGDKTFADILDDADIPYYQVRNFKRLPRPSDLLGIMRWLLYFIPCIVSLVRLIRRNKVDIVHVNGIMNVQVSLATKLSGAKLVWHLNDVRNPKLLKPILLPLLYILPDKLVGTSEAVGRCYLGNGSLAREMVVLYPPVDTSKFHPNSNIEEYRREFGLKPDEKVIGIVGNINPVKGYEYFFSAARFVKEAFPKVKFLVVGKRLETQEKYWHQLHTLIVDIQIEDDIILAGYRADIPELVNSMDIFVSASVFESASMVVMEALACARPIVATQVGGVPELVMDGETGILIPPKDPKAISKAVLYLLNHPEEAREMGLRGRQRMIGYFDLAICAQRHEEIYNMLL